MMQKPLAARTLLLMFVAVVVLMVVLAGTSHCATTASQKHSNSLGFVQYQGNPNSYIAGAVKNVAFGGGEKNYGIAVRVQPMGTYSLFTEEIFLCGDPTDKFVGKHNPMLIVYETVSHHTVEGIGCHELRGVHELKEESFQ